MNTGGIFAWMCINQDSLIIVWSLKKKNLQWQKTTMVYFLFPPYAKGRSTESSHHNIQAHEAATI